MVYCLPNSSAMTSLLPCEFASMRVRNVTRPAVTIVSSVATWDSAGAWVRHTQIPGQHSSTSSATRA